MLEKIGATNDDIYQALFMIDNVRVRIIASGGVDKSARSESVDCSGNCSNCTERTC